LRGGWGGHSYLGLFLVQRFPPECFLRSILELKHRGIRDPGLFTYKEVFFPSWFWLSLYKQDFVFKTPQLSTSLYPSGGLPIIAQWTQIITIIIIIIAHVKDRPRPTDAAYYWSAAHFAESSKPSTKHHYPLLSHVKKTKLFTLVLRITYLSRVLLTPQWNT
jgi:hypothetical protein